MSATLDEQSLRACLDDRGQLVPGSIAAPSRDAAWVVFAQAADARVPVDALRKTAERFFAAKLGLTVDKRYDERFVGEDAARVVLATGDAGTSGTRFVFGRLADGADVAAVEAAERAQGSYGMALLAQRCGALWLILPEAGDVDRVALTLAAIFAATTLGPILPPGGREAFGVRTARERLERLERPDGPYR